jgi:hypothetical protein
VDEGLAEPAQQALERARLRVKDGERAVADVEAAVPKRRSRAIVHVLALQLVAEMRAPLN